MSQTELLQVLLFGVLLVGAALVVLTSLNLGRRTPAPGIRARPFPRRRDPRIGSLPARKGLLDPSSARQGGQILEYLGKLASDFEPLATDEEISTPRGAVEIPMAIAVRGEVRVLYPLDPSLSTDRIDETLRRVALIRRHRFPEARIAFLSERKLPLELALCASPESTLGRLVCHAALHVTDLREGRDDAGVFRQVFLDCTGEPLDYGVDDLARVDDYLRQSEPIAGPITPGLRRLGTLVGRYLEWVLVGFFADRMRRDGGRIVLSLDGGDLDLDPASLGLEAIYTAGRLSLAGLARDLRELADDSFFIPREVSPAILQRFPAPAELARYRRPLPLESALVTIKKRRLEALAVESEAEELATFYLCPCGGSTLTHEPLGVEEARPCRSLAELESRLMDALQNVAGGDGLRCGECFRQLGSRELRLLSVSHPLVDRAIDLWVTLDRLPSGKFWWHLTRLRRGGDVTHYATVLSHSTFRRAFGRFFSVKEAWALLFQRAGVTLRPERQRAEPGLMLHAAADGIAAPVPSTIRRVGFFDPVFVVPLPRDSDGSFGDSPTGSGMRARDSFLTDERELRALGFFGRPPQAWARARSRPFRRVFEREVRRRGARYERKGLGYRVLRRDGGESFRDLASVIVTTVLAGGDYLGAARRAAHEAADEAARVRDYLGRATEVLGPGVSIRYLADSGVLEVAPEGVLPPYQIQLKSLISKTSLLDGSFERYLRMAMSHTDMGVGVDVCGCGARAFVSKKVKPPDWPRGAAGGKLDLARRVEGGVSVIYTRDCREHSHYLAQPEIARIGLTLDDLEHRYQEDLDGNSYGVTLRAVRVDGHLFFAAAGFNAASLALSGGLMRGLLDAAQVDVDMPAVRFLATTTGSLVIGEPEAPSAAFREAAKVGEALLREAGESYEALEYEGLLVLPQEGRGEFRLNR